MKYDLIVVGGGPGGLMAAKTAAEDGLKVLLIERKRNITEVNRACTQIFYINKIHPFGPKSDGYIDPVSVEIVQGKCRFHFSVPDFSLDYDGPLTAYYNWIQLSPSKYQINLYKPNDKIWGFFYQKETFLAGLLSLAEKAGVKILTGATGLGAENASDGVRVRVKGKSGEEILEARRVIAADGSNSRIVESLGFNKNRRVLSHRKIISYIMEGMETDLPRFSWLSVVMPSLNPFGNVMMGILADNQHSLVTGTMGNLSPDRALGKFMKHPSYAPWFHRARVLKKISAYLNIRTSIKEPVAGNVLIIGDAAAPVETWIQGATACGYQGAKAILKELNGQNGYPKYIDWWQKAFYFNNPNYSKLVGNIYPLNKACSDDDVDYIFSLFQGRVGLMPSIINSNLELIKEERPELYQRLKESLVTLSERGSTSPK